MILTIFQNIIQKMMQTTVLKAAQETIQETTQTKTVIARTAQKTQTAPIIHLPLKITRNTIQTAPTNLKASKNRPQTADNQVSA